MKYFNLTIMAAALAVAVASIPAQSEVLSLRGARDLAKKSKVFEKKRVVSQEGGFKRSWKLQPPSIPHKITKERITLEENTCLRCHSPEKYKEEKAPKIGDSHFVDAMGKKSDKINNRRYFCVQCHTNQVDAKPLVENVFNSNGN